MEKVFAHTAKNTVNSPKFLLWDFVERHSFRIVLHDSPKTMRELHLSAKLPHQEIGWNQGIFRSATWKSFIENFWAYQELTKVYSPAGGITGCWYFTPLNFWPVKSIRSEKEPLLTMVKSLLQSMAQS